MQFLLSVLRWRLVWPFADNHIVEIHVLSGLVHSSPLLCHRVPETWVEVVRYKCLI